MGQDILAQIVGATVRILPLIAIPFLLKGVIDGVPVLGNALQKGFNKVSNKADQGLKASGLGARRRAQIMNGERNMFGLKNNKLGKDGKRRTTTLENLRNRRDAVDQRVKSIEEGRKERFRESAANYDPKAPTPQGTSLNNRYASRLAAEAHSSHEALEDVGIMSAETDQTLKTSLAERRVTSDELRARVQRTRSGALAEKAASNKEQQIFTGALRNNNDGLLDIAQGRVDSVAGRERAKAAAVSAEFDVDDQGIKNQKALLTQELADIQKRGDEHEVDASGAVVMRNGKPVVKRKAATVANDHLVSQLGSKDFYQMAAARDLLMAQGSSGVDKLRQKYQQLEESGHFDSSKEMQDLKVAFARNTVSEHGSTLKAKSKDFLNALITGDTVTEAGNNAAAWSGQNNDELAAGTTSSLLRGISSGGIDAKRAAAILSDDVIRNKYDAEKVQMLQVLKDGGNVDGKAAVEAIWDKNTGKVKSRPNAATVSLGDTDDTIKVASVVVPGVPVPNSGNPVKVFKDFIEQASGISRLDRDDFKKLKTNVETTTFAEENDDVQGIRATISAEVRRRNEEGASINAEVGRTVYQNIGGEARSTTAPTVEVPTFSNSGAAFTAGTSGPATVNPQNIGPLQNLSDLDLRTMRQVADSTNDARMRQDVDAEEQRRRGDTN